MLACRVHRWSRTFALREAAACTTRFCASNWRRPPAGWKIPTQRLRTLPVIAVSNPHNIYTRCSVASLDVRPVNTSRARDSDAGCNWSIVVWCEGLVSTVDSTGRCIEMHRIVVAEICAKRWMSSCEKQRERVKLSPVWSPSAARCLKLFIEGPSPSTKKNARSLESRLLAHRRRSRARPRAARLAGRHIA